MSRVRLLASSDAARHAEPASASTVAPDESDPLALLGMSAEEEADPADAAAREEASAAETAPEALSPVEPVAANAQSYEPVVTVDPSLAGTVELEGDRAEMLDVIASLAPILRAVQVFPGPTASANQLVGSIRMLSQDSVRLADMLARATDACEIDVAWRRRRCGVLVSDLVANHWISTVIGNQGVAAADMWPTEGVGRIAAAFCAAADLVHESEILRGGPVDLNAIVLGLAPVHIDMERTAEHMRRLSPEADIDVDAAVLAIAVTASEEVAQGAERILQESPSGATRSALAAELMVATGPMAQAAWDAARGEMYSRLKAVEHDQAAMQQLVDTHMQGGLPVKDTCERLRVLVRRLVSMSVYAAKAVAGGKA